MEAAAWLLGSVVTATGRWAARCPPCPTLTCGNVSVALACNGPATVAPPAVVEESPGSWAIVPLCFAASLAGGWVSRYISQARTAPPASGAVTAAPTEAAPEQHATDLAVVPASAPGRPSTRRTGA